MKIEKKKVLHKDALSATAKSALAATLGMAATFSLNACDNSVSAGSEEPLGRDVGPAPESSAQVEPLSSAVTEGPETSSETVTPSSSSEKVVDIPLSQESISSEAVEALSAVAESSSSEVAPASSTIAPESSSETTPASSATTPSSSSVNLEEVCSEDDPWCIQIHMCENQYGCMAASMVTTFERDDITG